MSEKNLFAKPVEFFKDLKSEIKKIIWPKPRIVFKNTGIVLLMIFVVGLFVFGLDTAFMSLLGLIMEVSG
ncbi:MAG: preprotein translocase subunit SecE [Oscillospiraceae bacterium]|nr:preprotein translocase subunit SecE [Oscillospiraceae bacterium]